MEEYGMGYKNILKQMSKIEIHIYNNGSHYNTSHPLPNTTPHKTTDNVSDVREGAPDIIAHRVENQNRRQKLIKEILENNNKNILRYMNRRKYNNNNDNNNSRNNSKYILSTRNNSKTNIKNETDLDLLRNRTSVPALPTINNNNKSENTRQSSNRLKKIFNKNVGSVSNDFNALGGVKKDMQKEASSYSRDLSPLMKPLTNNSITVQGNNNNLSMVPVKNTLLVGRNSPVQQKNYKNISMSDKNIIISSRKKIKNILDSNCRPKDTEQQGKSILDSNCRPKDTGQQGKSILDRYQFNRQSTNNISIKHKVYYKSNRYKGSKATNRNNSPDVSDNTNQISAWNNDRAHEDYELIDVHDYDDLLNYNI